MPLKPTNRSWYGHSARTLRSASRRKPIRLRTKITFSVGEGGSMRRLMQNQKQPRYGTAGGRATLLSRKTPAGSADCSSLRVPLAAQIFNLLCRRLAVGGPSKPQGDRRSAEECGLQIRDTAQRGGAATKVAQSCTLPYRRFAIGWPFGVTHRLTRSSPPQNTILRYSRLQICATKNRRDMRRFPEVLIDKSALRRLGHRRAARDTGFSDCETSRISVAFTLVELLVVMAIIAVLATIGLPALKGFGKGNADAAAHRQMLDDIALARLRAISGRTTVYMVFVPPGIGGHVNAISALLPTAQRDRQTRQLTNLISGQYAAYALFARRSVGSQPGRQNPRYLTEWKRLPDGILIATNKFDPGFTNNSVFAPLGLPAEYGLPFNFDFFPFPSSTSPNFLLPYIAFNSQGQLLTGRDELIPLARGSI